MKDSMDEKKGLDYYIKLCQEQDEEIKMLNKEKDWLLMKCVTFCPGYLLKGPLEIEDFINTDMQQSLKE